jgi:hypothetical protein
MSSDAAPTPQVDDVNTAAAADKKKPAAEGGADPAKKKPRTKSTYMLHHPTDMTSLGKFVSTGYRYAALKVASRVGSERYKKLYEGLKQKDSDVATIVLRETGTKDCRVFEGKSEDLKEPKVIERGARKVVYNKKPVVKELKDRAFTYPDAAAAAAVDA